MGERFRKTDIAMAAIGASMLVHSSLAAKEIIPSYPISNGNAVTANLPEAATGAILLSIAVVNMTSENTGNTNPNPARRLKPRRRR